MSQYMYLNSDLILSKKYYRGIYGFAGLLEKKPLKIYFLFLSSFFHEHTYIHVYISVYIVEIWNNTSTISVTRAFFLHCLSCWSVKNSKDFTHSINTIHHSFCFWGTQVSKYCINGVQKQVTIDSQLENTKRDRILNLGGVQNFGLDQVYLIYSVWVLTRNVLLFDNFVAL